MKSIEAKCPHCGAHVVFKFDAEYDEVGDIYKLQKRGSCNRCSDLHDRQMRITDLLEQIAHKIRMCDDPKTKLVKLREQATTGLKAYIRVVCDWERLEPVMDWDEAILEMFVAKPKEISEVISGIWSAVRHIKSQQKLL